MSKRRKNILLLEDNRDLRGAFVSLYGDSEETSVFVVCSVAEGLGTASREIVDAAVVDLGGGRTTADRLEMIRTWRRDCHAFPIVVTTANDYEGLIDISLTAGADDFLRKPYLFGQLKARLSRHMVRGSTPPMPVPRRIEGVVICEDVFTFAGATIHPDLTIHFPTSQVTRLSAKQVGILRIFADHAGKLLFKDKLLFSVWGADANSESSSLNQYIHVLRKLYLSGGIDLNHYVTLARSSGWRISADAVLPRGAVLHGV